ncbi:MULTISPECIES: PEP-CTERM sorting domain-containing protein [Calothrix]|uniref:PEP-CTERM sorting domain-containing protein n=2 Tax=Calothrix TaxID=1186 RepID=A0ABR8A3K1_9CYAN|nr:MULTISPECIES: PEP-CTERM sorting domain-containing protein [Calothrix]MBD2194338.1 PEP-CTERM sorting domain-containing protein [Calothrix parietina FACHB-288]MBD2227102.1 PEP-CTERM sorting domain-containing protein [Calothrix anomala FACHB-343]
MKLTKHVSVAAASLALTVAAVNAKPAEAASIKFLGQEAGNLNKYNYGVFADSPNEKLGGLSSLTLSQLSGVTEVNAPPAFAVVQNTIDTVFLLIGSSQTASANKEFTNLRFSVLSSFTKPGPVRFAVVNSINASGIVNGDTTGPVNVPEPMTVGGSLLAVGFAAWMKRKKAELAAKA